jgi:shikimate dehydrogenase
MSLPQLRKQIDKLDDRIVGLLNHRLKLAKKIGNLKAQNGDKIYDPHREKELLTRLTQKKGALTQMDFVSIYRIILKASRNQQRKAVRSKAK